MGIMFPIASYNRVKMARNGAISLGSLIGVAPEPQGLIPHSAINYHELPASIRRGFSGRYAAAAREIDALAALHCQRLGTDLDELAPTFQHHRSAAARTCSEPLLKLGTALQWRAARTHPPPLSRSPRRVLAYLLRRYPCRNDLDSHRHPLGRRPMGLVLWLLSAVSPWPATGWDRGKL